MSFDDGSHHHRLAGLKPGLTANIGADTVTDRKLLVDLGANLDDASDGLVARNKREAGVEVALVDVALGVSGACKEGPQHCLRGKEALAEERERGCYLGGTRPSR